MAASSSSAVDELGHALDLRLDALPAGEQVRLGRGLARASASGGGATSSAARSSAARSDGPPRR
jgi:hypothetical protein